MSGQIHHKFRHRFTSHCLMQRSGIILASPESKAICEMGGLLKNAQRKDLDWIVRILNAGRPGEMGEPVKPHVPGKPAEKNLEWTNDQAREGRRSRKLRGVLEPIVKCMKELPRASSLEHKNA